MQAGSICVLKDTLIIICGCTPKFSSTSRRHTSTVSLSLCTQLDSTAHASFWTPGHHERGAPSNDASLPSRPLSSPARLMSRAPPLREVPCPPMAHPHPLPSNTARNSPEAARTAASKHWVAIGRRGRRCPPQPASCSSGSTSPLLRRMPSRNGGQGRAYKLAACHGRGPAPRAGRALTSAGGPCMMGAWKCTDRGGTGAAFPGRVKDAVR